MRKKTGLLPPSATKRLKAYQVSDGDDMTVIRYAASSAVARREGGSEIGCEWDGVDSCHRKPEYDQYAPGPVPSPVLIADGWGFECSNISCWQTVTADTDEKVFSQAGDVYCCQACMARHFVKQRANAAAAVALQELVETRLPGCRVTDVYVYGERLEAGEGAGGMRAFADFSFPGGRWPGRFVFGEDGYRVHGEDMSAFRANFPVPEDSTPETVSP